MQVKHNRRVCLPYKIILLPTPPPMAINLLTLHVHFRKIAGGYFSKFSCEIFKVVFLFFIYQVMEATKSNWTSLYFVAAYILVNMVIMK